MGVLLTRKERRIVTLVNAGMRNRDIAQAMGYARETVKDYLHVIFNKTGMGSRLELALWWEAHREDYV